MENKILTSVRELDIPGVKWESGKVRDWTDNIPFSQRLIVSTDRISAFDVVLAGGILWKGWVLNQLSIFWRNYFRGKLPNIIESDLVSSADDSCLAYLGVLTPEQKAALKGRMMLVRKVPVVPVEAVVRGYASGSFWKKYVWIRNRYADNKIQVWDHELPLNLQESSELPEPIFTPTTKAPQGEHDIPLRFIEMEAHIESWIKGHPEIQGKADARILSGAIRSTSLAIYNEAREYARKRGIIIADTKLEFGWDDRLILIDELLTPDSSRFWDADKYCPGGPQPSFDKQPVRGWLEASGWNKKPPAPALPAGVVQATTERYRKAYEILTGRELT